MNSSVLGIELLNNKFHGLSPPGGFVSSSGVFTSLSFDQAVPNNPPHHLADQNAICILHRSYFSIAVVSIACEIVKISA